MIIRNLQYHDDLTLEEYLQLPGISYSSIKGFEGVPTEGMRLGTRVHQYLNEPDQYDWVDADKVLPIAKSLQSYLGEAYHFLEKETSFTCDFIHNGITMPYKGRIDMMKAGRLVVDIKVLSGSLAGAIERFGYNYQVSGYCLATGATLGILVAWNKIKERVEVKAIRPDASFWEYQIVRLGQPV